MVTTTMNKCNFEQIYYMYAAYLTLPHLASPRLASPRLDSPRLALPCHTLPYLALPCLTLPYLTLPCLAIPYLFPRVPRPITLQECILFSQLFLESESLLSLQRFYISEQSGNSRTTLTCYDITFIVTTQTYIAFILATIKRFSVTIDRFNDR